jgi:hypothetical protein
MSLFSANSRLLPETGRIAAGCLALLIATADPGWTWLQTPEETLEILGKRSSIQIEEADSDWIRIEPGTKVYEQPHRGSSVVDIVVEPTDFEVLERESDWAKILYGGWIGWVAVGREGDPIDEAIPIRYSPDEVTLLRARSILRDDIEASSLGPFELLTDVDDQELLSRLSAVATNLPEAYRQRFGLDPGSAASELVVIFESHDDYLRFESGEPDIAGTGTRGYTGRGISVLSVGDREVEATVEVLVHELTHLLNRRVFGMNSPAWVEEGLAEDLAYSRVDENGKLELGSLGGVTSREVSHDLSGRYRVDTEVSGGRGMLSNLLTKWGESERPSLTKLLDMPWIDFIQPEVRPLHYAESAFFVRFMLASSKKSHAQGLLNYLDVLAVSSIPQGETLWAYTEMEPHDAETAYYRWLRRTAAANGL